MRVGHLRGSEFFGGPERAIIGHCTNMKGPTFHCMSFVRRGRHNEFLARCAEAGIRHKAIDELCAGDFSVIPRIHRYVKEAKLDILVSHDYKSNFMALLALKGTGVRHVRYFRGFTWGNRRDRFYNAIDRFSMRRMQRLLAVSGKSAEILSAFGIDHDRIAVVPNAIEAAKLAPNTWRRRIAATGPLRFVVAGRLSPEKGHDVLIQALALLPEDHAVRVEIYGEGPQRHRLEGLAKDLGVAAMLDFRGFVADLLPVLRDADGMILPSRSEGMPNILLESWAQKCPVIATSVGGVPEMIEDGRNGLLCEPEDPADLAVRIRWALDNRRGWEDIAEAGFRDVCLRYTYDVQSSLLDAHYRDALSGP